MDTSDLFLFGVLGLLVLAVYINLSVMWKLYKNIRGHERIEALTAAFVISIAIAAGIFGGSLLGVNAVLIRLDLPRIISMDFTLPLLLFSIFAPTAGNDYLRRVLNKLEEDRRHDVKYGRRASDTTETPPSA